MDIKIISAPFEKSLYGCSGAIINNEPAATGFRLMGELWRKVKENNLLTTGINYWVYLPGNELFAGVELMEAGSAPLEHKKVSMARYAWYKHTGPYNLLGEVYKNFIDELGKMQIKAGLPYLEIYGHHSDDESKCETEVLMAL